MYSTKEKRITAAFIIGIFLLFVALITLYTRQFQSVTNPQAAEVQGETSKITTNKNSTSETTEDKNNPEFTEKTTTSTSTLEIETEEASRFYLEGNGCASNTEYPNYCELILDNSTLLNLKECNIEQEENTGACNRYMYELGRQEEGKVYVFQSFEESGQKLTDIYQYSTTTKNNTLVDTVLYENISVYRSQDLGLFNIDPNSLENKVNQNNQRYLEVINQYK